MNIDRWMLYFIYKPPQPSIWKTFSEYKPWLINPLYKPRSNRCARLFAGDLGWSCDLVSLSIFVIKASLSKPVNEAPTSPMLASKLLSPGLFFNPYTFQVSTAINSDFLGGGKREFIDFSLSLLLSINMSRLLHFNFDLSIHSKCFIYLSSVSSWSIHQRLTV